MPLVRVVACALTGCYRGRNGLLRLAVGASFAALTVCAQSSMARAGDYDDPSGQTFGTQILKAIGLPDPDHPDYEINYSERSPLVVPPNRNLPAPVSSNSQPANWPQDPDFKKRQAAKAAEKVHVEGDRVIDEGRPLRPDELTPKGSNSASSGDTIEQPHKNSVLHRRTATRQPDRSASGLSDAVTGPAVRNSARSQRLQARDARRAHGNAALGSKLALAWGQRVVVAAQANRPGRDQRISDEPLLAEKCSLSGMKG
jgi:hypothetical protein